jgi:hypothetical protein
MNIDEYKDRRAFSLKIELAGVICSAVCLLVRAFVFPGTVTVLLMLIPLAISLGIGLGKSVIVQEVDDEFADRMTEELEKANVELREEYSVVYNIVTWGIYFDIVAAVVMIIMGI